MTIPLPPPRLLPDLGPLPALLESHVRTHYTPTRMAHAKAPLADIHREALLELSELFTSEREDLPAGYLTRPRYRGAYLLYFVPTGVATVLSVLRSAHLFQPPPEPGSTVRILDLGAGPLTASLAVALALPPGVHLDVVAVDGAQPILEDGRSLIQAIRPGTTVQLVAGNLRDGRTLKAAGQGFDVVLMANILNEWEVGGRKQQSPAEFVSKVLAERLAPGGVGVLVEPGTRNASHHLIEVREHLLAEESELSILAPCMGGGTCPLAGSTRDWCHSEQTWTRPPLVTALDEAIGHRRNSLKFSYLVLADRPVPVRAAGTFRIIGGPMRAAGQFRRYLCGPDGRVVATWPERQVPADLRDAWRGDPVTLPGIEREEPRGRRTERVLVPAPQGQPRAPLPRQPPGRPQPRPGDPRAEGHPPQPRAQEPRGQDRGPQDRRPVREDRPQGRRPDSQAPRPTGPRSGPPRRRP
jgi:hypothetical protein